MGMYIYSAVEVYNSKSGKWEMSGFYKKTKDGTYRPAQLVSGGSEEYAFLTGNTSLSYYLDDHGDAVDSIEAVLDKIDRVLDGGVEYGGLPYDASDELKEYFKGFTSELDGRTLCPGVTHYTLCELLLVREYCKELPPTGMANFDRYFAPVVALLNMVRRSEYVSKYTDVRVLLWLY